VSLTLPSAIPLTTCSLRMSPPVSALASAQCG
jgi:hypothetical protein